MSRRVVVTGTCILSPIGNSTQDFLHGLKNGEIDDSIRTIQLLVTEIVNTIVNTVNSKSKDDDSKKSEESKEKKK